jgi:hypothetical protein
MKMRLLAATAAAAMAFAATSANAASVITNVVDSGVSFTITTTPAADLGGFSGGLTPAGLTMIADFDGFLDPNFSVSGANIFPGGVGGAAAPPGDATKYNSTQPGSPFTLTALNGRSLTAFSFYMGSPDDGANFYNQLDFNVKGGPTLTRTGTNIWGGNAVFSGNQSQGFFITYTFDTASVTSLKFSQVGSPAFEFDNISGTVVPEPGTWALMILGFGGAGAMLRRRRAALVA